MSSLDRRAFARTLSLSGLAFLGFRLTGCGPASPTAGSRTTDDGTVVVGATVTMYDLRMEAWSTLGSGQLGFTGTLKASQIKDDVDLDLPYSQDPHGHVFRLAKADLRKLRKGESVSVLTSEALGHRHEVRIDPVRNRVPNGESLTMPVDPDAVDTAPTATFFATFDETDTPGLYVAGSAEMDPESVEFCLASTDKCSADSSLWRRMQTYVSAGRSNQMFASEAGIALDQAAAEQALTLRGKLKTGGTSLTRFFKFVRK